MAITSEKKLEIKYKKINTNLIAFLKKSEFKCKCAIIKYNRLHLNVGASLSGEYAYLESLEQKLREMKKNENTASINNEIQLTAETVESRQKNRLTAAFTINSLQKKIKQTRGNIEVLTHKMDVLYAKKTNSTSLKRKLNEQKKKLISLNNQFFQQNTFEEEFKKCKTAFILTAQSIAMADKCPLIAEHNNRLTKIAKTIGNILLPITIVGSYINMLKFGRNHAFFTYKTDAQCLGADIAVAAARFKLPTPKNK